MLTSRMGWDSTANSFPRGYKFVPPCTLSAGAKREVKTFDQISPSLVHVQAQALPREIIDEIQSVDFR